MTYAINNKNQTARFESKAAMQSRGNAWAQFDSAEELAGNKAITTGEILAAFNALTGSDVAKFSDKLSGAKRLVKALDETPALGKIGGQSDSTPLTQPDEMSQPEKPQSKAAAKEKANKKAEGEKRARSSKLSGRVFLLHRRHLGSNPRRKGSHGHRSLGLFIDATAPKPRAISYETFIEEGGRAKDLRWDILNGNVEEVVDGKVVTPAELAEAENDAKE